MSSTSAISSALSSSETSTSAVSLSSILAAIAGTSTPGIDVTAAVTAGIYADRAPERIWQSEQTTLTSQKTALTAIQTATQALSTDFTNMNSFSGTLSSRTVTSTASYAVTGSATTSATNGTHSISITSLAQTASWYSDVEPSATAALPTSSFTITTGSGSTATFNVGSGGTDTLNDLATSINSSSLGLKASVVTDSTGARLSIVASASGTAANFTVTSNPVSSTSWSSPSFTSSQSLGANSFTIAMGGTTSTITTTSGETLSQLASDINGQSLGVTASVVTDSVGSHLSIVSSDGSTPFSVSEPSFGFTQAQAGADASLTVDGVPITSATNTVTGAITGVTLNLASATAGSTVNLTIGANTSSLTSAISQFVTDYNNAISQVNSQFSFSSSTSSQGVLSGDPTMRQLQQSLMGVLSYTYTPSSGSTSVSNLSALGISVNTDGTLALDTDTLSSALTNNPTDVQNFFMGDALNGFASKVVAQLNTYIEPANGAFTVDLNSINSSYNSLTDEINDFEANYIANQQTLLTSMYSTAEAALQSLPTQLKQIQAELGNNNSNS